jgi:hypothetical protein
MDNPDKTGNSGYIRRRKKQHTMRWTPSRDHLNPLTLLEECHFHKRQHTTKKYIEKNAII